MALDKELINLKSAGVYRFEEDRSQIIDMPVSQTRLLMGFSKKGPFNTPVYIRDTKQFKDIFGDIDRTLEKKGSYFHRSCLTALLTGPIYVMNMLKLTDVAKFDPTEDPLADHTNLDEVGYLRMSTAANVKNDKFRKALYSGMFNTDKFWYADSDAFMNAIHSNKTIDEEVDTVTYTFDESWKSGDYHTDELNDLLNFTNISKKPISIIVKKSDNAQAYNLTALDWYGSTDVPAFLNKDSMISDFFVDVYVISGNFGGEFMIDNPDYDPLRPEVNPETEEVDNPKKIENPEPYARFATDPIYQKYFDKVKGLKRKFKTTDTTDTAFTSFINESEVSTIAVYTGCLIPNFVDKFGNNIYIEKVINNNVDQIGLLCSVNETLFDDDEYIDGIEGGLDLIGHTAWDLDGNQKDIHIKMLSYDVDFEKGSSNGEDEIPYGYYNYTKETNEDILRELISEAKLTSFENNMIFIKKDLTDNEGKPLSGKDKLDKVNYYSNLKVGNYMIGANVWKDLDGQDDEDDNEWNSRLTRINTVRNVILRNDETYILVICQSEIKTLENDGVRLIETIDTLSNNLHVYTLNGFKLKKGKSQGTEYIGHIPNGDNGMQNAIIDYVLGDAVDSAIAKGLQSRDIITFRYIVDTFGLGLEANCKWKFASLCKKRQSAFAILNAPAAKDFRNSMNPSFKDGAALSSMYISQGGNLSKNPDWLFSLPTIEQGASWCGFYYPYITIRDLSKNIQVPPAAYVSNNYMEKYVNAHPWSLVAGTRRGVISGSGVVGVEVSIDDYDRDYLEPFGFNCIVWKKNVGPVIFANKTAQQTPKSALSSIHVREAVIYIQDGVENILKHYLFEMNTAQTRLEIKTLVDNFLKSVQANDGVYDFKTVMNESNNTPEVIDNNMGVLDMYIEPVKGLEIIAQRLTILKTGAIATGEI